MPIKNIPIKIIPLKKLLLVGAGHAHIGLLRRLRGTPLINADITLISEQPQSIYSGMLPGWMAGHYILDDIRIDIAALCKQAGVHFIQQPIVKIDAKSQRVMTADDYDHSYEVVSLNTGADTDMHWLNNADINSVIAIRPLHSFVNQWSQVLAAAQRSKHYQLAIIGAGAAAIELVMAAQVALQRIHPNHQVFLICGDVLLAGFNYKFRHRVIKQLKRLNIEVVYERAIAYQNGTLMTERASLQQSFSMDAVIAATGVTGAAWTTSTDIATVDNGFIAVNALQQSVSHNNVFAVGDVATRVDKDVAHSGVHAVHGGEVTADNLLTFMVDKNKPLQSYQPKNRTLYLLSCGDKYAIASWGSVSLQGRWVWYIKRYIDKRFVNAK
ncbi:FAD-dependent oxidoreductase [Psychrobacter okhotskensis]|uniref:FAD-dependent oxidoreductase n=1 Tax=Psychrobacter okhotskensis TaxID=212403 RepID=UPI0019188884|nr:FAD-dependent oxidoreductase [Psychrobacter okhotskensis]